MRRVTILEQALRSASRRYAFLRCAMPWHPAKKTARYDSFAGSSRRAGGGITGKLKILRGNMPKF